MTKAGILVGSGTVREGSREGPLSPSLSLLGNFDLSPGDLGRDRGLDPKMTKMTKNGQNRPRPQILTPGAQNGQNPTRALPDLGPDPPRPCQALSCPCRVPPPSARPSRTPDPTQNRPKWPKWPNLIKKVTNHQSKMSKMAQMAKILKIRPLDL